MVWHVYEFEKTGSSLAGMFSLGEWKERLQADAGTAAVELGCLQDSDNKAR
ncbi:hypothetical protein V4C53_33930 [Paraburkholderia azotifigens]|uniref:hypothetical protein n=1 Tax=Paraburkholderia azotifigens TaxID=2057004 RepID=UPI0031724F1D